MSLICKMKPLGVNKEGKEWAEIQGSSRSESRSGSASAINWDLSVGHRNRVVSAAFPRTLWKY